MSSTESNSNTTSGNDDEGGGVNVELFIAVVALVVSLLAFVIATLQAIQQYLASAAGFSSCGEAAIGKWARFTRRRMRWAECRFEVIFEHPVLFVAFPSNQRGPLGSHLDVEIIKLDGSPKNDEYTSEPNLSSQIATQPHGNQSTCHQNNQDTNHHGKTNHSNNDGARKNRAGHMISVIVEKLGLRKMARRKSHAVSTVGNETATWCALLTTITRMEKESRQWQTETKMEWEAKHGIEPPPRAKTWSPMHTSSTQSPHLTPLLHTMSLPAVPSNTESRRSLVVCMQRKRLTWDSMPRDSERPYAITTISHLIELAAMLGIYWRQFDLSTNQYRAQGGGLCLFGSYQQNVGIGFTFLKEKKATKFGSGRLLDNYRVKELCFGYVPTIFGHTAPEQLQFRQKHPVSSKVNGLGLSLERMQLGCTNGIAHTLAVLGCDAKTVGYFREPLSASARHNHLFPSESLL